MIKFQKIFETLKKVLKIISHLSAVRTCQNSDIPTKIIKLSKGILAKFNK